MMGDHVLSDYPVLGKYVGLDRLPNTDVISYCDGPIAIQDPSEGLMYQAWRSRLVNDRVLLVSEKNTPEYELFTAKCITAIDLAFDQNGRYLLLYIIDAEMWLYWFDPLIQGYTHALLDTGVTSARMTLDDKRPSQIPFSEIILGYIKEGNLYMRSQNDRYTVSYLLQAGTMGKLIKIGMSSVWRIQFLFEQNPFPVYEDPWPYGAI